MLFNRLNMTLLGSTLAVGCAMTADGYPEAATDEIEEASDPQPIPELVHIDPEEPARPTEECYWVEVEPEPLSCETHFDRDLLEVQTVDGDVLETIIGAASLDFTEDGLLISAQAGEGVRFAALQLYAGTSAAPIVGDRVAHELFPVQESFDQPVTHFELLVSYEDLEVGCGEDVKVVLRVDAELDGALGYEAWLSGNDHFGPGRGYFEYYENCCVPPAEFEEVCEFVEPEPEPRDPII